MSQPDRKNDPGARSPFIIAVCPSCTARLRVPRDIANTKTACPECKALINLAELRQAADGEPIGEPVARVKCPACGTVADFQARICVECGLDFRTGKKLRRPQSTAEKLQRVNRRIKEVRSDLRKEMKRLVPQAVFTLGLLLVIACLLLTVMPLLGSWGAVYAAIGMIAFALASLAWLSGSDTAVCVRQVRQEALAPLVERRDNLQRECAPRRYWLRRLWLPVTALLCVMATAMAFGLAWIRDARSAKLDSSLLSAIKANDPSHVRDLLSAGASPNGSYGSSKSTPLHTAAQHGYAEVVGILIDAGAHVDAADSRSLRPLDKCVNSWMVSDTNDTGYADTVAMLVECGAKLTAVRTREHPSRTDKSELDERLGEAAKRGRGRFVEFLLSAGADPNVTDLSGATPLARCIAARHDHDTALSVIKPLLEAGGDPNLKGVRWSPIHDAVEQGDVEIVRCLLEHGGDPGLLHVGRTPLDIAAANGQTEMTALLQHYAN